MIIYIIVLYILIKQNKNSHKYYFTKLEIIFQIHFYMYKF